MQSLLLRLFNSDFFDTWLAISYLYKYPDSGIQEYLCKRLVHQPISEIEFLLPQLCHLLVTRTSSDTISLENLLVFLGCKWSHFSISILWFLDSYESDFTEKKLSFYIERIARLKTRFQSTFIHNEFQVSTLLPIHLSSGTKMSPFSTKSLFVGLGSVVGSIISPHGFEATRRLVFQQAFYKQDPDSIESQSYGQFTKESKQAHSISNRPINFILKAIAEHISPSWEEFYGGRAFSLQRSLSKLESAISRHGSTSSNIGPPPTTVHSLSSNTTDQGNSVHQKPENFDHDSQRNGSIVNITLNSELKTKSSLNPNDKLGPYSNILSAITSIQNRDGVFADNNTNIRDPINSSTSTSSGNGQKNSHASKSHFDCVLNSAINSDIQSTHYYHSEMAFISALNEISERLCRIPKSSRQKALQAELTLLNHNLPANLCVPFWCKESLREKNGMHARILRISPTEAVVLNSAERVPYMILVEVESNFLCDPLDSDLSSSESDFSSKGDSDIEVIKVPDMTYSKIHSMATSDFYDRMRTAAILLAQLHQMTNTKNLNASTISTIRSRIIKEMEVLDTQRAKPSISPGGSCISLGESEFHNIEDDFHFLKQNIYADDPSGIFVCEIIVALVLNESWEEKIKRVQKSSPFGSRVGWSLYSLIVKSSADLRQELLAVQIIKEMLSIWNNAKVASDEILVTSGSSGLIETITDSISIHSLKKEGLSKMVNLPLTNTTSLDSASSVSEPTQDNDDIISVVDTDLPYAIDMDRNAQPVSVAFPQSFTLLNYFIEKFGSTNSKSFINAREHFLSSLVGYSLLTYLLSLKDRHNGNILIDKHGHLIHIDFGFMLSNSPGYVGFESAPFKLVSEWVEILGGPESTLFKQEFKERFVRAFLALRKHADRIILLVEIMMKESSLPCFYSGADLALYHLRERFVLSYTDGEVVDYVGKLISASYDNVFTKLYDSFQYYSNGIL